MSANLALVDSLEGVPAALVVVDEEITVGLEPDGLAVEQTELVARVFREAHDFLKNTPKKGKPRLQVVVKKRYFVAKRQQLHTIESIAQPAEKGRPKRV